MQAATLLQRRLGNCRVSISVQDQPLENQGKEQRASKEGHWLSKLPDLHMHFVALPLNPICV